MVVLSLFVLIPVVVEEVRSGSVPRWGIDDRKAVKGCGQSVTCTLLSSVSYHPLTAQLASCNTLTPHRLNNDSNSDHDYEDEGSN